MVERPLFYHEFDPDQDRAYPHVVFVDMKQPIFPQFAAFRLFLLAAFSLSRMLPFLVFGLSTILTEGGLAASGSALVPCQPVKELAAEQGSSSVHHAAVDFIFIIDSTASMNGTVGYARKSRWAELQENVLKTIEAIPVGEGHRLYLLLFGGDVYQRGGGASLQWLNLEKGMGAFDGGTSHAVTVELQSASDRELALNVVKAHSPSANNTALFDAIGAGLEKALEVHARSPDRYVRLSVYSDGESNSYRRYSTEQSVAGLVARVRSQLGDKFIDGTYLFVRVGGAPVQAPADTLISSRTPILASIAIGPEDIQVETLALPGKDSCLAEISYRALGLDGVPIAKRVFPLVFVPSNPAAPHVRVVCSEGGQAAVGQSGYYRIRFQRIGDAAQYADPFEGTLELDLGRFRSQDVEGIRLAQIGRPIRVKFAGAPTIPVQPEQIKPADGLQVLVGTSISFEAPSFENATYEWRFSGAADGAEQKPTFTRQLNTPGTVLVDFVLQQEGKQPFKMGQRRIEVIDPQVVLKPDQSSPIEGETVRFGLSCNPKLHVRAAQWSGLPTDSSADGASYQFTEKGSQDVAVDLETDIGTCHGSTNVDVGPGIPYPQLLSPEPQINGTEQSVSLFKQEEPQVLAAVAGGAVQALRFVILQNGAEVLREEVPVGIEGGQPIGRKAINLPAGILPGKGILEVESVPKDTSLLKRLGERKSKYDLEIRRFPFSMEKDEPTGTVVPWDQDITFCVAMDGIGISKVRSMDWKVELVDGASVIPISIPTSHTPVAGAATKRVSILFKVSSVDRQFASLLNNQNAYLRVSAQPVGDPLVIGDQTVVWDGIRPAFEPAGFVIEMPRYVELDKPVTLTLVDRLSGAVPEEVGWEVIDPDGKSHLLPEKSPEVIYVADTPKAHEVRATVKLAGGRTASASASFYAEFEPAYATVEWDGGTEPNLQARGATNRTTKITIKELRGTHVLLDFDVCEAVSRKPVPGAPSPYMPSESDLQKKAFPVKSVAWPSPAKGQEGRYSVRITVHGFSVSGREEPRVVGSFTITNLPERRWWLILSIVAGVVALIALFRRLCWKNEARGYSLSLVSDPEILKTVLAGICDSQSERNQSASETWKLVKLELDSSSVPVAFGSRHEVAETWSLWTKKAFVELRDVLPRDLGENPAWLAQDESLRTLRVCVIKGTRGVSVERQLFGSVDSPNDGMARWSLEGITVAQKPSALNEIVLLAPREARANPVAIILWNDYKQPDYLAKRLKLFGATAIGIVAFAGVWLFQALW
jgi:hypothetical protein